VLYRNYRVTRGVEDLTDLFSIASLRSPDASSFVLDVRSILKPRNVEELQVWIAPSVVLARSDPRFTRPDFLWEICIPPHGALVLQLGRASLPVVRPVFGSMEQTVDDDGLHVGAGATGAIARMGWRHLEDVARTSPERSWFAHAT
jgi:hypothetical protein